MMKRIILFLLIAALLSGCTGINPDLGGDGAKKITEGGNLDIFCYNAKTFNPLFSVNNANIQMLWLCFEPLFKSSTDRSVVTVLAQGYFISEDGLTWTVPMKNDVYWHDGTKFTAFDAEATLNTVMKSSGSVYSYNTSNIAAVTAEDENILKIKLKAPQTNFAALLEIPMLKKESCAKIDNFTLVGTGAYKYKEMTNKAIIFEKNPKWHGDTKPHIDTVTAALLPDKKTSVYSFNSKIIDAVTASIKDWSEYPTAPERGVEFSTGDFIYLKLNTASETLSNYSIRTAVASAIDRDTIRSKALLSHGVPADTIINPKWHYYSPSAAMHKFDAKAAAEIITAENGGEPINLQLLVNEGNEIKTNTAELLKVQLAAVNIHVDISYYGWDDYLAHFQSGNYDIALCEIKYTPDTIPESICADSERAMACIRTLQLCGTDEARLEAYKQLQGILSEECVVVPLFFDMGALLYNEVIGGGMSPTETNIYNNIQDWYLSGK